MKGKLCNTPSHIVTGRFDSTQGGFMSNKEPRVEFVGALKFAAISPNDFTTIDEFYEFLKRCKADSGDGCFTLDIDPDNLESMIEGLGVMLHNTAAIMGILVNASEKMRDKGPLSGETIH